MPRSDHQDGRAELSALERALVDLVRLGLAGDGASVRQLARRLISHTPAGLDHVEALRQAVGELLIDRAGLGSLRRATAALALPADTESTMPLVKSAGVGPTPTPVLNEREWQRLQEFITERRHGGELRERNLEPSRTLLLTGPPGVGKTLTAHYIAHELGMPLYSIDLAGLMSSFLGRTGQNLRRALDFARQQSCVLLIDEFDAVAKRRDDEADVGELKRIVNVLLLELEHWPSEGILIAATNHPELLDRAVGRRFDLRLDLELPGLVCRRRLIAEAVERLEQQVDTSVLEVLAAATEGLTGHALVRLVDAAAIDQVIAATPIDVALLSAAGGRLHGSRAVANKIRAEFAQIARSTLGLSDRAIAKHLGVTHPTVARLLNDRKPSRGRSK